MGTDFTINTVTTGAHASLRGVTDTLTWFSPIAGTDSPALVFSMLDHSIPCKIARDMIVFSAIHRAVPISSIPRRAVLP